MKVSSLVAAALAATFLTTAPVFGELKVGDAVTFKMVGSDGKTYSSADFQGKQAVVIAWYPKAFTGG